MNSKRTFNKLKITISTFLGILLLTSCDSERVRTETHEVSEDVALNIAKGLFKNNSNPLARGGINTSKTIEDLTTYKTANVENAFYVINYNEGGFVIIAADDRVSPMLAYADEGKFSADINQIPEPVLSWMEEEKEIVQDVKDQNAIQIPAIKNEWDVALGRSAPPIDTSCNDIFIQKGPHLTTSWGQWNGYNNLVNSGACSPNWYNSGKAPTGCIATAMAQIMKYWHKPNSYNWNNMPDTYGTIDTQILMRDIGNGWINYDCSASSQESCNIPGRFNQLGYQASFTDNYDLQLVMNQVNWQPVILSGGRKKDGISWNMYTDGHAWVCDGYQYFYQRGRNEDGSCNGMGWTYVWLHMNWGWGDNYNNYNGWYNAQNFNPSTYTFNYKRKIVYNIHP